MYQIDKKVWAITGIMAVVVLGGIIFAGQRSTDLGNSQSVSFLNKESSKPANIKPQREAKLTEMRTKMASSTSARNAVVTQRAVVRANSRRAILTNQRASLQKRLNEINSKLNNIQ